jgi:hypothetical protein
MLEIRKSSGNAHFLLDGRPKTLTLPTTGSALHAIAGNPTSLTSAGKDVPNDSQRFDVSENQEFVSSFGPKPIPALDEGRAEA